MSYETLLNILVTIQSKANGQSASGSVKFTWSNKSTAIKSRKTRNLQPKIFDDIAKTYVDEYKFYFLADTDVTVADRIVLADGRMYEITSVDTDSSGHHKKAYAKITKN